MGDCFSTNNSAHYVQLHYDADDDTDTNDDTDDGTDDGTDDNKGDDTNGNIESELNIFYVTV